MSKENKLQEIPTQVDTKPERVLPGYHYLLVNDPDETGDRWSASVVELKGCISQARTIEEVIKNIMGAQNVWIETFLEKGFPIPPPNEDL